MIIFKVLILILFKYLFKISIICYFQALCSNLSLKLYFLIALMKLPNMEEKDNELLI